MLRLQSGLSIWLRPLLPTGTHVLLEISQKPLKISLTSLALPAATFLKLKGTAVEKPLHHAF